MADNVTSKVVFNLGAVKKLRQAQITALEKTAEALHTRVVQAQVVPRDTGNLQNESMFVDLSQSNSGKVAISHTTPYARRCYFHPEFQFKKDENPNAKGKWFEDWLPGGKEEDYAQRRFNAFYKKESGV